LHNGSVWEGKARTGRLMPPAVDGRGHRNSVTLSIRIIQAALIGRRKAHTRTEAGPRSRRLTATFTLLTRRPHGTGHSTAPCCDSGAGGGGRAGRCSVTAATVLSGETAARAPGLNRVGPESHTALARNLPQCANYAVDLRRLPRYWKPISGKDVAPAGNLYCRAAFSNGPH